MAKKRGDIDRIISGQLRIRRILGRLHLGSTMTTLRRALAPVLESPTLKESLAIQLTRYAARRWAEQLETYYAVMGHMPYPSEADIGRAMLGDAAVRRDLMQ